MRHINIAVCLGSLFSALTACCFSAVALPLSERDLSSSESLLAGSGADGKATITSMRDKTTQLKAYRFESVLSTQSKGKVIVETGHFYFKSPNLIRFELTKGGKRTGAVVVRQPDGKIRGKMGGALGGVKVTLAPDSKLLRSANGFSVLESDLGSLLSLAIEKMSSRTRCLHGKVAGVPQPLLELLDNNDALVYRMSVKEPDKLPDQWNLFQGGKLFSTCKFMNLQILSDLPDSVFALAADASEAAHAAGERSVRLSIPDYRRRMNAARAEMLVDGLNKEGFELSADGKGIVQAAIDLMQEDLETLKVGVFQRVPEGNSIWAPGGERRLVESATRIELILSALPQVAAALKKIDRSDAAEARIKLWSSSVASGRTNLSELLGQIDQDVPDADLIDQSIAELQKQTCLLREIMP